MSDRSLTPIFDDLPEWVKDRLAKASLQRKDWKSCSHCKVHEGKKKLMACTQCKPFLIIPTYYCSRKCQRAEWPRHKAYCISTAFHTTPVSQQKMENHHFVLRKRVEHWLYIHEETIRQLILQLFYFRTSPEPRSTAVFIHLHIDDANSDPPRVWPTKIELLPKVIQSTAPWSTGNGDFVDYCLTFPGGPITMSFLFQGDWRADTQRRCDGLPAYDLIFLNLFLAAPQTSTMALMQWKLIQVASKVGRKMAGSPFLAYERRRLMNVDGSLRVLNLVQSDELLKIFKESRIWDHLDQEGYLESLAMAWDEAFPELNVS